MALLESIGDAFGHIGRGLTSLGSFGSGWVPSGSDIGEGKNLRYPSDLADGENPGLTEMELPDFVFNSSSNFNTSAVTPYIKFQLYQPEMDYTQGRDSNGLQRGSIVQTKDSDYEHMTFTEDYKEQPRLTYQLKNNISLYMTPNINISDSMHYESGSRAAAAFIQAYDGMSEEQMAEDVKMGINEFGAEAFTAAGAWATSVVKNKFLQKIVGTATAVGGAALKVTGDEGKRLSGKVFNPNEYLQFKNSQLRTFDFAFKFLPNCAQESKSAAAIIKAFRVAMRPKKISALTMEAPYQVQVTFMGVDSMPMIGSCFITQSSVTYNPNAASYFKRDGAPVEIDFSLQLSEIYPLYRQDIEGEDSTAGFDGPDGRVDLIGPAALGFPNQSGKF